MELQVPESQRPSGVSLDVKEPPPAGHSKTEHFPRRRAGSALHRLSMGANVASLQVLGESSLVKAPAEPGMEFPDPHTRHHPLAAGILLLTAQPLGLANLSTPPNHQDSKME